MMEKRTLTQTAKFEIRSNTDTNNPVIAGYFSVFGQDYEFYPGLTESIDPHAFDGQCNRDVRALINHDTSLVLGRTTAGTLNLQTDDHGLYGEIQINPNDTDAMNCYERVKRGDVNQCSFGFEIIREEYEDRGEAGDHWTIKELKLHEVSVCTFPAYDTTAVTARSDEVKARKKERLDVWKTKMLKRLKGEN